MKCPKCKATLPRDKLLPGERIVCPACGKRLKLPETATAPPSREAAPDAGYMPGAPPPAPLADAFPETAPPAAAAHFPRALGPQELNPAASRQDSLPEPRKKAKGKKKKRAPWYKHPLILAGAGSAATLVVAALIWAVIGLAKPREVPPAKEGQVAKDAQKDAPAAKNAPAKKQPAGNSVAGATAVVIEQPDPEAKPPEARPISDSSFDPPEKLAVLPASVALVLPVRDGADEFAPLKWSASPDPQAKEPDRLPREVGMFYRGHPLFASGDGPYFVLHLGDRAQEIARAKDDKGLGVEEENSPRKFVRLIDLRTFKQAARFSWRVPLWQACRLSPEGTYIVGPSSTFGKSQVPNDGLLVVWKREEPEPIGELKIAGKVAWMDFLDDNRLGVLTYGPSPVLQIWDLKANERIQSVSLPPEEFPEPKARSESPAKVEPLAFLPQSVPAAVSPGGHYVALGGLTHIFVVGEGGVVGEPRWPASVKRVKKHELRDYLSLGYSGDGQELISVVNVDDRMAVYLVRWSTETGRVRAVFRITDLPGKGQVYAGRPLPGPAPDTLILPHTLAGYQTLTSQAGVILDATDGTVLAKLRDITVRVVDGGEARLAYGSFEYETRPDIDRKTPPWKSDPDPEKLTPEERQQWENRKNLGTAIYVAPIDRSPATQRAAAGGFADRPPAGAGNKQRLTITKPEPPATWQPLPAPPAPLAETRSIQNVPQRRPYFGMTHVAFIDGRKNLDDPAPQTGMNWHRLDLRSKPAEPISVPLWPWAATPDAKETFDWEKIVLVAAMSNEGELLALRDPANAARVDVWRSTGERIAGFTPYGGRPIDWVSWSAEGRLLTLGAGKLTGWDATTGGAIYEVDGDYRLPVEPARGRRWLVVSSRTHLDLLDTETGRCLGRLPLGERQTDPFESLALSPDATRLALCCRGDEQHCRNAPFGGLGLVRTWNLATGKEQEPVVVQRAFGWPIFLPGNDRVLIDHGTYDLGTGLPAMTFGFYGPLGLGPDGRIWTLEPRADAQPPAVRGPRKLPRAPDPNTVRCNLRAIDAPHKPLDRAWLCDKRSPIAVEVDLGNAALSRKMAQNMVARLTLGGFTVGPGGFRVRASKREIVTDASGAYAPLLGNQPMPGLEVSWSLLGPNGVQVWRTHHVVAFGTDSKYSKGQKATGKRVGAMQEIVLDFDFGDRNPREAILEELSEKSVGILMDLPAGRYYRPTDEPHDKGWVNLPVQGRLTFAN